MQHRRISLVAVVVAVVVGIALLGYALAGSRGGDDTATPPATTPATTVPSGPPPNIVVIMTDDQTLESMRVMENTRSVLAANGTSFSHYYASFPNCCPSRATYYTGQFSHNNGVRDNVWPEGGYRKLDDTDTLAVWLQDAGYYTAHIGKYLNGWGETGNIARPPGWTHWFGLIDPTTYQYFNYQVSDDGARKNFGSTPADYQTDVLGAEVVRTIGTAKASGKPFFISWTPLSPHVESPEQSQLEHKGFEWPTAVPAPRYAGRFADEPLPKTASYDEADVAGLPSFVTSRPRISPSTEALIAKQYRLELETLLATDEWVGHITKALQDQGLWDNTVVMFTSDNGLYHGEHRIPNGKLYLYEPGVHLPLIIAGPGFGKGVVADQVVGNVDLAATIAGLARVRPGLPLDGRDLRPLAADPGAGRGRGMLLENQKGGESTSSGIHTDRYVYLEHSDGTHELYDLASDPDQVRNLADVAGYAEVRRNLADRLAVLRTCRAESCEGSDAGGGAVPPGPPDPGEDTGSSGGDPVDGTQVSAAAVSTLAANFTVTNEEQGCITARLGERGDLTGGGSTDFTTDPARWAALLGIGKACISSDAFRTGMTDVLAGVLGEGVPPDRVDCVAKSLDRLGREPFESTVAALIAPTAAGDATAVASARGVLTGCRIDARRYFR